MLDICDKKLFQTVLTLDDGLRPTNYGPTYYQLLGVNVDCNKEELIRNYGILRDLMEYHNNCFMEKETTTFQECYKDFNGFFGSTWYEHKIGSAGMGNTQILYENNKRFKENFNELATKKDSNIIINYLKNESGVFVKKEISGKLKSVVAYDSISFNVVNDAKEEIEQYRIDFLGKDMAIIDICDENGKVIYVNPYLKDDKKLAMYHRGNINAFRVLCYNFFMAKVLDVTENADVIERKEEESKVYKKI